MEARRKVIVMLCCMPQLAEHEVLVHMETCVLFAVFLHLVMISLPYSACMEHNGVTKGWQGVALPPLGFQEKNNVVTSEGLCASIID